MRAVTCNKCGRRMSVYKELVRENEQCVYVVWQCQCGVFRQTRRTGAHFRFLTDENFREREREYKRKYYHRNKTKANR